MLESVYVSRVFPLGAADAIEAIEAWYSRLELAAGGRRLVGGPRLLLRPCFEPTDFDPLLLRLLRGTLRVGWWWPVRIELELTQYSRFACEIALRPSTVRWPVGIECYGQDAAKAVEGIVASIMTGVPALANQSSKSGATRTGCAGRTLMPSPHWFADQIARRPSAFDPLSDSGGCLKELGQGHGGIAPCPTHPRAGSSRVERLHDRFEDRPS